MASLAQARKAQEIEASRRAREARYARRFLRDLRALLNVTQRENGSDTPDYILARYLSDCLKAFDRAVRDRSKWYQGVSSGLPVSPLAPG